MIAPRIARKRRATPSPAMAAPRGIQDLLLYRMSLTLAVAGAPIIRLCEGRFGITRREWRLLALLAHGEGMHSSELAERAQLDRARTSRSVTALEAKGLLERNTESADRRCVWVALTARGRAVFEQLWPLAVDHHRHLLAGFSREEIALFDRMLAALYDEGQRLFASYPNLPLANRRRGQR